MHDPDGHPVVVDWRAPVSRPFYRASPADPMGLELRRRFGFSGGELTAHEDEVLTGAAAAAGGQAAPVSRILIQEIERPRSGPMRDIVATIAPDQDDIVRAGPDHTLCVQGAPGTGKTAVGLHRIAYLLYAYACRMARGGVLVIGPNRAFLSYIRNVLPALGEVDVTQTTLADLLARVPVRARDSDPAAQVKGDPRMAEALHRAVWAGLVSPPSPLSWSVGPGAGGSARASWPGSSRSCATGGPLCRRPGDAGPPDRPTSSRPGWRPPGIPVTTGPMRQCGGPGRCAPPWTPSGLRRTPSGWCCGCCPTGSCWPGPPTGCSTRPSSRPSAGIPRPRAGLGPLEPADAVLVDEASDLIERIPSLAHVVLDEAQDLSPMECRAIGRRCATGSATVLGDLAQSTAPAAAGSWPGLLTHLGKPGGEVRVLETGYRVPRQILDYANQLLGALAPGLAPARTPRQDPDALTVRQLPGGALPAILAAAGAAALDDPGGPP